ncbi:MAG TPA: hypothetical protein VF530_01895 [Planctomycetota bacterium]
MKSRLFLAGAAVAVVGATLVLLRDELRVAPGPVVQSQDAVGPAHAMHDALPDPASSVPVESREAREPGSRMPARTVAPAPLAGAWLRGRLTSAERSIWGGYRLGLLELDESGDSEAWRRRADRAWESIRSVELDGRFELGPFPAGRVRVDLFRPVELVWRDVGEGDWNRLTIGEVVLEEGVVLERDFEVSERAGQLVIAVRVNGLPAEGVAVEVLRDEGCRARGETDATGRFGPFPVLAGDLRVRVSDPRTGWRHVHPLPIVARPGATVEALVPVEVVTARLLFASRRGGEPLTHRSITVFDRDGYTLSASTPTDAAGSATFSLVPGDYRFALNPGATPELVLESSGLSEVVSWSYSGPLVERVSL